MSCLVKRFEASVLLLRSAETRYSQTISFAKVPLGNMLVGEGLHNV